MQRLIRNRFSDGTEKMVERDTILSLEGEVMRFCHYIKLKLTFIFKERRLHE